MQLANQEAQRLNHEFIGTEHILLGLVKDGNSVAAAVLKGLDVKLGKVRHEVEKRVAKGPDRVEMGRLPMTPRGKKVIEYAIEEAKAIGHNYVSTEHILLGLLRESEGIAAMVLTDLGVKLEEAREEVFLLLGKATLSATSGAQVRRISDDLESYETWVSAAITTSRQFRFSATVEVHSEEPQEGLA